MLAVQRRPDLYHAFVGTGQMVSQRATDIMFWEDTLAWAESTGQADLAATLRENGPPPYADILRYEVALSHEHDWNPYPEWDGDRELPATLFVPENDLMDRVNGLRSFLDTFSVLYPQLQDIDFRRDVPEPGRAGVPGRRRARGPRPGRPGRGVVRRCSRRRPRSGSCSSTPGIARRSRSPRRSQSS